MKWWNKSWNPLCGCTECSRGCDNCMALENLKKQSRATTPSFNEKVFKNNLGSGINYIVGSLGDVFHEDHTCEKIDSVFSKMTQFPENRYFVQTKRSGEMKEYFSDEELPENIRDYDWESLWLGVTVEDNSCIGRIDDLIETPIVKHRYLCLEPLLEEISIAKYLETGKIDWVILGCESGEQRRPTNARWIKKLIDECREHQVPVYVDQIGGENGVFVNMEDFPEEFKVREIPWVNFINPQEYNKVLVVEGLGLVGTKNKNGKAEFIIQAPEYIYDFWQDNFSFVGKAEKEFPFSYPEPQGNDKSRSIFWEVRDFISHAYQNLVNNGTSREVAALIVPKDVIVRFKWVPADEINAQTFWDIDNKEIKQYFKALKALIKEK